MNRPIRYSQKDPAWGRVKYAAPGENATIGGAGCGPTCAAMAISTITHKHVTPIDTCRWSMENGYKAKNQGTYYSYFVPQFEEYGIQCKRLNSRSLYGRVDAIEHERMRDELDAGHLIIACMGPGLWTGSGHYILVYGEEEGGKLKINDPASVAYEREHGAPSQFFRQVKYYWEVHGMTKEEAKNTIAKKAGLSGKTIEYLDSYRYGDDLILKLAKAMK